MRYVAAFRTYTWDDGVAELARRFFDAFPSARHIVFANESKGGLGIADYEVLSHGDDVSELGLPDFPPGNVHWYNVDYALYEIRKAIPGYDYYVTSESDLAVNLPLERVVLDMESKGIDMIVHELLPSAPPWHWHANAAASFPEPWRALCFFMIASGATIDELYRVRLQQSVDFIEGRLAEWPFCETFVPSTLKALGLKIGEIGSYADVSDLRYRPRLCIDDPRANRPGSMAHSVLPQESFYRAVLRENKPTDWFLDDSELSRSLHGHDLIDYGDALLTSLRDAREHAAYQQVKKLMSLAGASFEIEADIAFLKPAITSSTSPWSNSSNPQEDASFANGSVYVEDMAFHTQEEQNPWWMVDLTDKYFLKAIEIVNRLSHSGRFRQFSVETSLDGSSWKTNFIKIDFEDVSADKDHPYLVSFDTPVLARYVRLSLLRSGVMHLRRIRMYGEIATDDDLAVREPKSGSQPLGLAGQA